MELRVEPVAIPEKFSFNYEELKAWATDIAKSRENIVFSGTKEEIALRKKDRSELNRIDKILNDERIRLEREYMRPFDALKSQINEVRGIIKASSSVIDSQIKEIEEQQKQKKADAIAQYWDSVESPEWLDLDKIYDSKWLNVSVSMKSIQEAINVRIDGINSDLSTLSDLPEFSFEATEVYKHTLDLNKSIAEGHRLSEMQKRKVEQERIKAEQEKERAEQERLRKGQEERARIPDMITPEEIAESADAYREAANVGGVHMPEELSSQHQEKEEVVQSPKETPAYVCFKALLTVAQALELKEFFESRNIEFSRI